MDNDIEVEKTEEIQEGQDQENSEVTVNEAFQEDAEIYVPNTESEVMLFLAEELEPLRRTKQVQVYDLETEYAKTCKNKLWSVWIMLFLTFVMVALVTVFTIKELSARNENIVVNFSSFKDLELQNLFNQFEHTKELFDAAAKEYAELKGARDSRLTQAKVKYDNDMSSLQTNSKLSRMIQKNRIDSIHAAYNSAVAKIHADFDERIKTAEADVKQFELQLRNYDSETVALKQEWEQRLDSERQSHQLEKQRLIENYEAQVENLKTALEDTKKKDSDALEAAVNEVTQRYEELLVAFDPVIKDSKTTNLISEVEKVPNQWFNAESFITLENGLSKDFAKSLRELQTMYDNLELLYGHSAAIPNKNTMKSIVNTERKLSVQLANKVVADSIKEIKTSTSSISEINKKLKETEDERDYLKSADKSYVEILNKIPVDESTIGFVLDSNAKYGAAVLVLNGKSKNIRSDGSTRVEIYDGSNKLANGAILGVSGDYYISLDNDADKKKISVGNTFRLLVRK